MRKKIEFIKQFSSKKKMLLSKKLGYILKFYIKGFSSVMISFRIDFVSWKKGCVRESCIFATLS